MQTILSFGLKINSQSKIAKYFDLFINDKNYTYLYFSDVTLHGMRNASSYRTVSCQLPLCRIYKGCALKDIFREAA